LIVTNALPLHQTATFLDEIGQDTYGRQLAADPNEAVSFAPSAAYNFAVEARDIDSLVNIAEDVDAVNTLGS